MRNRLIGALVFLLVLVAVTSWRSVRAGRTFAPFNQPIAPVQPAPNRNVPVRPPEAPALSAADLAVGEKFCGMWAYEQYGSTSYFKVSRVGSRFRFEPYQKYEGKFSSNGADVRGADGIYLQVADGQLKGEFVSGNFYATHGQDFTYRVTLAAESNDTLSYSVYFSMDQSVTKKAATKVVE